MEVWPVSNATVMKVGSAHGAWVKNYMSAKVHRRKCALDCLVIAATSNCDSRQQTQRECVAC